MEPNKDIGEVPIIDWIAKDLLDVDHAYQRPEDARRVERMVATFRWERFGALVLTPVDGRYHVIDGQHRARAAQLHPEISVVPAVIMPAVKGRAAEAGSFLGHNADRKAISPLQLYHAALAAGDDDATTVHQVCERAAITVLRTAAATYRPGDTIAVAAIGAMIGRRGAMRARQVLDVIKSLAPIGAIHVKAAEALLTDSEFVDEVDADDLQDTVKKLGASIEAEANAFAATHCLPRHRAWAALWFKKTRKKRKVAANA